MPARPSKPAASTILRFERIGSMLGKIVDNAAVGMVVSEMDGRMVYANRAFVDLLGHRIDEAASDTILDLIHADDDAAARQRLGRLMRGEAGEYRGEHRFRHADGGPLWVMVAASVLRSDTSGDALYLITQVTSIELQKRAEEALAHSESRWNFALESARQGVWDHDIRTDTMFYSRMWRVMRGIPPDEEVDGDQAKWLARIHPDDVQHVLDNSIGRIRATPISTRWNIASAPATAAMSGFSAAASRWSGTKTAAPCARWAPIPTSPASRPSSWNWPPRRSACASPSIPSPTA